MLPLYFAPINTLGNASYRHLLLEYGADFVFSELLMADKLKKTYYERKITLPNQDIPKTIFQIGAGNSDDVEKAVDFLTQRIKGIKEINLNMGCPQSSLQQQQVCGGLLLNQELMGEVAKSFVDECAKQDIIPSVKLRLGISQKNILIKEYVQLLSKVGIKKIYIHLRPLRYNYMHPVLIKPVIGLQEEFSEVEFILNGDIDSYESYEKLTSQATCKGIMIGRSALSNPLIFEQIKNKTSTPSSPYNPLRKDVELLQKGQHVVMSKRKQEFIKSFLQTNKLPLSILKANLSWLTKGVSGRGKFIESISSEKDRLVIIERFKEYFSS